MERDHALRFFARPLQQQSYKQLAEVKPVPLLKLAMGAWDVVLRLFDRPLPHQQQKRGLLFLDIGLQLVAMLQLGGVDVLLDTPFKAGPVKAPHRWHQRFEKL